MARRLPLPEIGLALFSLALSALGSELYLRRFHPIHGLLYRLHPRYLHTLIPGARRLFVHQREDGGRALLVTVNSDGFLGPELARPSRGRRILVYGDSFVDGEFSPLEERFTTRLGQRLTNPGEAAVEVVNAGVVGYGPDQEALRLEDEIGPLRPDLVVVAVFAGNDFGDLMRNKIFRLDEAGRLVSRSPHPGEALRNEFEHADREARGSMLLLGLHDLVFRPPAPPLSDSLLPEGGYAYLLQRRRHEWDRSVRDTTDTVEHVFGDPYDADLSLDPDGETARYKAALMAQVLERMAYTARAHDTPLLFVFIPSAFDVGEGYEAPNVAEFPAYRPSALTDALAGPAERNGLPYVDLYPSFLAVRPHRLFFRRDEHWNKAGQALAADQVAAFVRARSLLR